MAIPTLSEVNKALKTEFQSLNDISSSEVWSILPVGTVFGEGGVSKPKAVMALAAGTITLQDRRGTNQAFTVALNDVLYLSPRQLIAESTAGMVLGLY